MKTRLWAALAVAVVVIVLAGCAGGADYSARFLRYETLEDGTRIAVVAPVAAGADPEQIAYTDIDDLEPTELVYVRWVGRSWDQPQWLPEREIVSRAAAD